MPLTETEILSRHKQSLSEAQDACLWLARNADPMLMAPRGHHYRVLRESLKALEGSCRQMAHWREDSRWLKLGFVYARAMRVAQAKFLNKDWLGFRELSVLFENGLVRMQALEQMKTGRIGAILPKNTDFMIMPELAPVRRFTPLMH